MVAFVDLTGRTFGRLVVLRHTGRPSKHIKWLCQCVCGSTVIVGGSGLKMGTSASCGCLHIERTIAANTTHGSANRGRKTRTYFIWMSMRQRCSNPKNKRWKRYGARGIAVCDQWQDFANFLADMGEKPPDLTLERVDNEKGYSPENCVWATPSDQARNKQSTIFVTINGEQWTLPDACERYKARYSTMKSRFYRGGRCLLTEADFE